MIRIVVPLALMFSASPVAVDPPASVRTGSLTAYRPHNEGGPFVVTVNLYRSGELRAVELVRTRELLQYREPLFLPFGTSVGRDRSSVTWRSLPEGIYEVHCEANGYIKSVKQVRVSHEDGDELEILVELEQERPTKKERKRR